MRTTKVFKNGNSQAIRIPAALAYPSMDLILEIERIGDEIRLRPAPRSLADVMEVFASFSADFMQDGRGSHTQQSRDTL